MIDRDVFKRVIEHSDLVSDMNPHFPSKALISLS
jgi:hypothetical protein